MLDNSTRAECKDIEGKMFSKRPLYNIDKSTQARLRYGSAAAVLRLQKTQPKVQDHFQWSTASQYLLLIRLYCTTTYWK